MNATLIIAMLSRLVSPKHLDDRAEIADAIASTPATPREAAWLAAIAFRESSYRLRAIGDRGTSFCFAQINLPNDRKTREGFTGPELIREPEKCALVALHLLRGSLATCKHLPEAERLAAYAGGSCESEYGRRVSRDRYRLATIAAGGAL